MSSITDTCLGPAKIEVYSWGRGLGLPVATVEIRDFR
jgi:hypothetical protein